MPSRCKFLCGLPKMILSAMEFGCCKIGECSLERVKFCVRPYWDDGMSFKYAIRSAPVAEH